MSVGALEPQFYAVLVDLLGLAGRARTATTSTQWPALREAFGTRFKERTQAEWTEVFDGTDACVAPVLPLTEAAEHPHLAARGTYVERDGVAAARAGAAVLPHRGDPDDRPERARAARPARRSPPGGRATSTRLIESGAAVQEVRARRSRTARSRQCRQRNR